MSPRQQAPLSLEYILLGLLEQNPAHGYDLHKRLNRLEGMALIWQIKQSQLYALLEKLEEEGLISVNIIPGQSRPDRRQYALTGVGRRTFDAWRTSPVQHGRDMRQEFLAKLYFAQIAGDGSAVQLVDEQRTVCLEWLDNATLALYKTPEDQSFDRMVFQFRITQVQAMLAWLAMCRTELIRQVRENPAAALDRDLDLYE